VRSGGGGEAGMYKHFVQFGSTTGLLLERLGYIIIIILVLKTHIRGNHPMIRCIATSEASCVADSRRPLGPISKASNV